MLSKLFGMKKTTHFRNYFSSMKNKQTNENIVFATQKSMFMTTVHHNEIAY